MEHKHLSETVNFQKKSETGTSGLFYIEGLYTGYGLTLGNALRRTLISSIPGAAITQVRVRGVNHEFSTVPGMVEDMVEFTMNLKKVRFKFFAEEPQLLSLKVKGEKEIKAGDIKVTSEMEIVNPDLKIAVLTDKKASLDMELVAEKGLGYFPAENRQLERLPIGTIVIDALFSPVANVNFTVENMRVGERTDYNRLLLKIDTDGSLTPSSALHKAINILKDHFGKIGEALEKEIGAAEEPEKEPQVKAGKKKKK